MIFYRAGYKYQLVDDYIHHFDRKFPFSIVTPFIALRKNGTLLIKRGYAWDGASGPAIDTKSFMRGSLVHDALYQLMRRDKISPTERSFADKELRKICREDGMSAIRAWWVYAAVKQFAARSAEPESVKPVFVAP